MTGLFISWMMYGDAITFTMMAQVLSIIVVLYVTGCVSMILSDKQTFIWRDALSGFWLVFMSSVFTFGAFVLRIIQSFAK